MKKTILAAIFTIAFVITISMLSQTANAQAAMDTITNAKAAIPEDDQAGSFVPWLVGILLTAGAIAVSFKNAGRTHLD